MSLTQLRIVPVSPGNQLQSVSKQNLSALKILLGDHLEVFKGTRQYNELSSFFSYPEVPGLTEPIEKNLSFSSGPYTIVFDYEHKTYWAIRGEPKKEHAETVSISIFAKDRDLTADEKSLIGRYNFEFADPNRKTDPNFLIKANHVRKANDFRNVVGGMKVEFIYITRPDKTAIVYPVHGKQGLASLHDDIITLSFSGPPALSHLGEERTNRWLSALRRLELF